MYAEERQQRIVSLARRNGRVAVPELATQFGVTAETIRRDLDALDERGVLRRVHGGAVPTEQLRLIETAVSVRASSNTRQKSAIARAALEFVPTGAGSSILLDAGTTTSALAALLPETDLGLVITNSAHAAAQLALTHPGAVELIGGRVRGVTGATVGSEATASIARLRVDVAFLGTNGVTLSHGLSTPDLEEASVKRAMISSARRVIALADSSKIGDELTTSFASIAQLDTLVTDAGIEAADLEALTASGLKVVVA